MDDTRVVAPRSSDPLPRLNIGFAWAHKGRELVVINLVKGVPTGFPPSSAVQATPACLIPAGKTEPLKVATSGWTKRPGAQTLDNEKWTALVRQFAAAVGFHLHWSIRDTPKSKERVPANDGRYLACHAEKKLGLFFLGLQIRQHGMTFQEALQGKLREADLPLHDRRAQIYLGHKPCKNCLNFLRVIRRKTGIDVRTSTGRVFKDHRRKRTFYKGVQKARDPNLVQTPAATITGAIGRDGEDDDDDDDEERDQSEEQAQEHSYSDDDGNKDDDDDDGNDNDADDDIIETLPTGNVRRPQQDTRAAEEDDSTSKRPAKIKDDPDSRAMPPPPHPTAKSRMSVHSTPSPSPSPSLSVVDSVADAADRRLRYQTYSSPSRCGESVVATPSVWGDRGKPPVTPCLQPPDDMWDAANDDDDASSSSSMAGRMTSSPRPQPYEQSFFFGTPSVASTQNGPAAPTTHQTAQAAPTARDRQEERAPPPPPPPATTSFNNPAAGIRSNVYIPPYLRRLQQTSTVRSRREPTRGTATARAQNPRAGNNARDDGDDDVEFLSETPRANPSSANNNTRNWHPPMRAVDDQSRTRPPHPNRAGPGSSGANISHFPNLSTYRYSG